jgi:hypothetical protein
MAYSDPPRGDLLGREACLNTKSLSEIGPILPHSCSVESGDNTTPCLESGMYRASNFGCEFGSRQIRKARLSRRART